MPLLRRDGKTGAVVLSKDRDRVLADTLTPDAWAMPAMTP